MTTLLPFDLGGVTEILRLGNWEEGLAEISEVFGASLDPGLVEGPAGLWAGRGTNGEDSINLRVDSFPSCYSFDSWEREERSFVEKELQALSICCTTEDSTQSRHHLGLACMWRKRRDWKLWLQMMAETFGGAAGTGFLWEECLVRRMKDWITRWMDGQDIRRRGGAHTVNASRCRYAERPPTYIHSLLLSGARVNKEKDSTRSIRSKNQLNQSNKSYLVSLETGLSFDLQSAGVSVSFTAAGGKKTKQNKQTIETSSVPSLDIH